MLSLTIRNFLKALPDYYKFFKHLDWLLYIFLMSSLTTTNFWIPSLTITNFKIWVNVFIFFFTLQPVGLNLRGTFGGPRVSTRLLILLSTRYLSTYLPASMLTCLHVYLLSCFVARHLWYLSTHLPTNILTLLIKSSGAPIQYILNILTHNGKTRAAPASQATYLSTCLPTYTPY